MGNIDISESSQAILDSFLNEYIAAKKDLSSYFKNLTISFNSGFETRSASFPNIQNAIRIQVPADDEIIVNILGEQYRYILEIKKEQEVYFGLVTCQAFERTISLWKTITSFRLKRDGETSIKFSEKNYQYKMQQTAESGLHLFAAIANIHISGLHKDF
jgi:mRNA-degrading endonuclease HigB of HigAB toxin-antitoxin module